MEGYPHVVAGAHRVTRSLLAALPAHGWEGVVVLPADGPAAEGFAAAGTEVRVVEAPPALRRYEGTSRPGAAATALPTHWRRVARALDGVDVVHALDPRGLLLGGPAARLARRPLVWQLHTTSRWGAVNRLGRALAGEVCVMSASSRAAMPGLGRRATVAAPPVADGLRALAPAAPGPRPVVATIARPHPEKGLDVLVAALALLPPEVTLRVVGAGTGSGLERHDRVEVVPWADDPVAAVADAWAYVQPSRSESWGLALAEARAAGLAVVATDVPGLREQVADGVDGLLVPSEDPVALAAAIARLLDDRGLATRLGAAARAATLAGPTEADHAAAWAARYAALAPA
ncbi:MAG TPA: glycosyltransferase family 4 protein [Iamia sp.]|nr:glycosyltransferase family 4 protein [Iamia sp.]